MPRNNDHKYVLAREFSQNAAQRFGIDRSQIDKILIEAINSKRVRMRARVQSLGQRVDEQYLLQGRIKRISSTPRQMVQTMFSEWLVLPAFLPAVRSVRRRGLADDDSNIIIRHRHNSDASDEILVRAELLISDCDRLLRKRFRWPGLTKPTGASQNAQTWCDMAFFLIRLKESGRLKNMKTATDLEEKLRENCTDLDPRIISEVAGYAWETIRG